MRRERLLVLCCWCCALAPVAGMLFLAAFLAWQSRGAVGLALFFGDTPPWDAILRFAPVWDGIWPACAGTLCVVALSGLTAVPTGLLCGIYLSEFAHGRARRVLSLCVDILAGIPSILMGLFGFAMILFLRHTLAPDAKTGLALSGVCMGLLVLPYMINATATTLAALPNELRLLGPSLGMDKVQSLRSILLPSAGKGIMSGVILAIGRAAEDTAVIMLTGVVANAGLPRGLFDKYEALPFFIYTTAAEYRNPDDLRRGFAAALVLLVLTTALFASASVLHRTMERRWRRGT